MALISDLFLTYVKYNGQRTFKACDINEGVTVKNIIYASMIENTDENKSKLQNLANDNKAINLSIQLRDLNGIVVFQTK